MENRRKTSLWLKLAAALLGLSLLLAWLGWEKNTRTDTVWVDFYYDTHRGGQRSARYSEGMRVRDVLAAHGMPELDLAHYQLWLGHWRVWLPRRILTCPLEKANFAADKLGLSDATLMFSHWNMDLRQKHDDYEMVRFERPFLDQRVQPGDLLFLKPE